MRGLGRFLRRRARFTLAGLLLVVGVLSIALAHQANRVARQRRAIAAIKHAGGWVLYGHAEVGRADYIEWNWLRRVAGDDWVDGVARVYLSDTSADDETLRALADLPSLRLLYLRNTATSDAGLAHLAGLTRMQVLDLGYTRVSDEGLRALKSMTRLRQLSLENTNVSDDGMTHLAILPRLATLDVSGTRVTPDGVAWFPQYRGAGSILGGHSDWGWYSDVICSAD